MKTIVGIRPTGKLHIGHYFSVIKPALEEGADVLVARYHAPEGDWSQLVKELQKFNLKVRLQEFDDIDVENYFKLLSVAKIGELERMTQYKSAKIKTPSLLTYPVLMACDLVGYDKVIVGDDQKQHIEYANKLFRRMGMDEIKGDYRGGRIMSLTDPTRKMSKSEPEGCLFLNDDFEKKIMGAVTDIGGITNLQQISMKLGLGGWNPSKNKESKERLIKKLYEIFGRG